MTSMMRRLLGTGLLLAAASGVSLGQSTTGPEVGEKIPKFELKDQHGRSRDFNSLAGDQGLLLLFSRSADW